MMKWFVPFFNLDSAWRRAMVVLNFVCVIVFVLSVSMISGSSPLCTNVEKNYAVPEPDITNPGPDTPSFPTSPFTLPVDRAYIENYPVYLGMRTDYLPRSYNWSFLGRIGIADNLEARVTSPGLTIISADCCHKKVIGFSQLNIGFKVHLWGERDTLFVPSGGLELYFITPIASEELNEGPQCFINGLFDSNLSHGWNLEWNIGVYSRAPLPYKKRAFCGFIDWALQKNIVPQLSLFFEGYFSTGKCPFFSESFLLGIGFQSNLSQRVSLYGSYIWSIFKSDQDIVNIGFAVAF